MAWSSGAERVGPACVFEGARAAQRAVAAEIAELVRAGTRRRRAVTLGLPTGSTMVGVYTELARLKGVGALTFARVRAFALDEYEGLGGEDPLSFRAELERGLLAAVDLPPEQADFLDGRTPPARAARHCAEYEASIREAGGMDLLLLGLGLNGHVAFDEPGCDPDGRTARVELAPATRLAAAERFGGLDHVPTHGLTMGLATLRDAKRIRLLAFGNRKRTAVERLLHGPPGDDCPASLLAGHPDLRVLVDAAAVARG